MTPPTFAQNELAPTPTFLMTVGNSSAVHTYMMAYAAAAPALPSKAKITVTH